MPHDWLFDVESILIRLVPAYTLETIDESDIERLLPYYFYDYRKALREKAKTADISSDNIVIRDGKKYRKVTADKASWAKEIF